MAYIEALAWEQGEADQHGQDGSRSRINGPGWWTVCGAGGEGGGDEVQLSDTVSEGWGGGYLLRRLGQGTTEK